MPANRPGGEPAANHPSGHPRSAADFENLVAGPDIEHSHSPFPPLRHPSHDVEPTATGREARRSTSSFRALAMIKVRSAQSWLLG